MAAAASPLPEATPPPAPTAAARPREAPQPRGGTHTRHLRAARAPPRFPRGPGRAGGPRPCGGAGGEVRSEPGPAPRPRPPGPSRPCCALATALPSPPQAAGRAAAPRRSGGKGGRGADGTCRSRRHPAAAQRPREPSCAPRPRRWRVPIASLPPRTRPAVPGTMFSEGVGRAVPGPGCRGGRWPSGPGSGAAWRRARAGRSRCSPVWPQARVREGCSPFFGCANRRTSPVAAHPAGPRPRRSAGPPCPAPAETAATAALLPEPRDALLLQRTTGVPRSSLLTRLPRSCPACSCLRPDGRHRTPCPASRALCAS